MSEWQGRRHGRPMTDDIDQPHLEQNVFISLEAFWSCRGLERKTFKVPKRRGENEMLPLPGLSP